MVLKATRLRWMLRILLVLLLVILLVMIGLSVQSKRKLNDRLKIHRALTAGVAHRLPRLAPGEPNASHALDVLGPMIQLAKPTLRRFGWRSLKLDQEDADGEAVRRVEDWLDQPYHRMMLEIIDRHADVVQARSSSQLTSTTRNLSLFLSSRSNLGEVAGLLKARAYLAARSGDPDASHRDIRLILRLGDWLGREQTGVAAWIFRNEILEIGLTSLEQLWTTAVPGADQRRALERILRRLASHGSTWGLEGERALIHDMYWRSGRVRLNRRTRGSTSWIRSWGVEEEVLHNLNMMDQMIRAAARLPHLRSFRDAMPHLPEKMTPGSTASTLSLSITWTDIVQTRLRLAFFALAWEDYRQQYGAYPKRPRDMVPEHLAELPVDPWTGNDLMWKLEPRGCRVYSVGINGRDEGGADPMRYSVPEQEATDIAWRLPCP